MNIINCISEVKHETLEANTMPYCVAWMSPFTYREGQFEKHFVDSHHYYILLLREGGTKKEGSYFVALKLCHIRRGLDQYCGVARKSTKRSRHGNCSSCGRLIMVFKRVRPLSLFNWHWNGARWRRRITAHTTRLGYILSGQPPQVFFGASIRTATKKQWVDPCPH